MAQITSASALYARVKGPARLFVLTCITATASAQATSQPGDASGAADAYWPSISGPYLDSEAGSGLLPDDPESFTTRSNGTHPDQIMSPGLRETRPFRSLAVGLTLGSGGIGIELATPLTSKLNLRGGSGFFSYTTGFVADTVPIDGTLHLQNSHLSVDWFPFGSAFHISPGITLFNHTSYNALIYIPGNQVVDLNDVPYTSDPLDPIRGTAHLNFGARAAPRLTAGFGNVVRHRTARLTFPVEFGVIYTTRPTVAFSLTGSSCDMTNSCDPIQSDPQTEQNILLQQAEIADDLKMLRFFPIISFGVSYKFGH